MGYTFRSGPNIGVQGYPVDATQYKVVAASCSTTQISRSGNAVGDYLDTLVVIPATTAAGAVTLLDGSTTIFATPAQVTGNTVLVPYSLYLGMTATSTQGWVVTCGANVSAVAVGRFDH